MKKLLVLLPAVVLALAGCDGDTCITKPAELESTAGGCGSLAAGAQVTIQAALHCQTCSDTDASCVGEVVGQTLQVDAQFRECESNRDCGAPSCQNPRPTVLCQLRTPAASGSYELQYLTAAGLQSLTVNVGAGGTTSCTL